MTSKEKKGNKVDLQTFKNWGKENIFGVKTEEKDGRKLVHFIWCKICAAHKDARKIIFLLR